FILRIHGARARENLLAPFHAFHPDLVVLGTPIVIDKSLRRYYDLPSGGEQTLKYRILISAKNRQEFWFQGQRLIEKRLLGFHALQDGIRPALLCARTFDFHVLPFVGPH